MKTRERILLTALTLFNKHGENAVTSVDIALELDISPGNLYYHFKGKESMVVALMRMHEKHIQRVLVADKLDALNAEDVMYYFYLLIDSLHVFRFFYRSPADLAEKYPSIARQRTAILRSIQRQLTLLFTQLEKRALFSASATDRALLVELLSLVIFQSCQFDELNSHMDETSQRYHALSLIMVSLLPRLAISEQQRDIIRQALDSHAYTNMSQVKTNELSE
ncbi:MAG TPA: TetR family transcriptional regulator [Alteromonas australica]|uniref:TetR family transcriptional regulator n=1 Tax=Alteromonas australica TaxID=589873 RepID=A0A358E1I9_9ALTE|nr:TetR/AcrR family transcriptional regulator [Alteromonas australica]MAF69676.1 TetR family transcriptional regulator [Alteromonas sp.]AJP44390.1 transcriptional regulator [Alteromonas australica]MBU32818.1 TetR family transcriptional regulator [Alteromonas sp.]HAI71493.1 TetR family transcriptional regulator [Alteromonas australica]HAU27256.1 TetR family transcriptional regulator [Alteromonas australica]|tara:strand:+ start:227 stop:892 length:666 start_codon:yes stop_codon:yes gene_type:complete